MNQAEWLARTAQNYPELAATALGGEVIHRYQDLAGGAARMATGLRRLGLNPGDRIGIFAANDPEYIEALYAIWWAGMVAVPINAKLHPGELAYIMGSAGIRMVLASSGTVADVQIAGEIAAHETGDVIRCVGVGSDEYAALKEDPAPLAEVSPEDLAWLFYTSGTTGRPKGAMLTHRNLAAMSLQYLSTVSDIRPGDAILHAAPMSHGSGLYILPHVLKGACQVIPESRGFDPAEIAGLLDRWSGVSMFAAPTMVSRLVRADVDLNEERLERLKVIVYGGAPMYKEDAAAALERLGPRLAQIYGQGETPMTITCLSRDILANKNDKDWERRLASVGMAFPMIELKVVDENGVAMPKGGSGEVVVRGETVMKGYWQQPEASAETIRDGWLYTGDIGRLDEDGCLTLMDRSKDLIISGGSNIYPREVEEVLLLHPDLEEVSVIGRPDPDWGEVVVAYIVGRADIESLDALCLRNIARFKRPKAYVRCESLPKSAYGKVLKSELRRIDAESRN
ncbi:class I adenylate-forming enzyme family protein [Alphaproteobacteria bacterium LSUCC0684]